MKIKLEIGYRLALFFATKADELIKKEKYIEAIDLLKDNIYESNIYQLALLAYAYLKLGLQDEKEEQENYIMALKYAQKVKKIHSEQNHDHDLKLKFGRKSMAYAQFVEGMVRFKLWNDTENASKEYRRLLNTDPSLARILNENMS